MYAVLAGGVGAARFLTGLVRAVDPGEVTVIGNVGDDIDLHGLHVCPDLDTVTYTLGGGVDPERGWGRAGDTHTVLAELARYGEEPWFTLGDRDLATHLYRTRRLREGAPLSRVTGEITRAWGLDVTLLPATDDPVETRIATADGRDLHFQEYWVAEGGAPEVTGVHLAGAGQARPAPGVVEALTAAEAVLVSPSNPVVSINTILAVPGIREAVATTPAPVVGISPVVGGGVLRGMADRLLAAVGAEVSPLGVARLYREWLDGFVVDTVDGQVAQELTGLGVEVAVTDTVMVSAEAAAALAGTALDLARRIAP